MKQIDTFTAGAKPFVVLVSAFLLHFDSFGQMNRWILNPTEIDFGAGTATPLTWSVGYPYTVENTAYDADGKVLFYIQNMNVYDANGTGVDRLPSGVYTYLLETEAGPLSGKFIKQ